jgi:hypothetical protein
LRTRKCTVRRQGSDGLLMAVGGCCKWSVLERVCPRNFTRGPVARSAVKGGTSTVGRSCLADDVRPLALVASSCVEDGNIRRWKRAGGDDAAVRHNPHPQPFPRSGTARARRHARNTSSEAWGVSLRRAPHRVTHTYNERHEKGEATRAERPAARATLQQAICCGQDGVECCWRKNSCEATARHSPRADLHRRRSVSRN